MDFGLPNEHKSHVELVETFYHLELRESGDGSPIERFDSRTPFPAFTPRQQLDLVEHAPSIRYVWHSTSSIGHNRDQQELHVTTIVWLGEFPPDDKDLARYDVRAFMERRLKEEKKRLGTPKL